MGSGFVYGVNPDKNGQRTRFNGRPQMLFIFGGYSLCPFEHSDHAGFRLIIYRGRSTSCSRRSYSAAVTGMKPTVPLRSVT